MARPLGRHQPILRTYSGLDGSFEIPSGVGTFQFLTCKDGFSSLGGRVVVSRDASSTELRWETHLE